MPEPDGPRVFAITVRTRYHVLAHSRGDAIKQLEELADRTPLDYDGAHFPWVDTIYTMFVGSSDAEDVHDDYLPGDLPAHYLAEHREVCEVCSEREVSP